MVLLVSDILKSISEPGLGVASEFIGVLCLKNLSGKSHWRFALWVCFSDLLLELVVFLFGVPIPFVNLLQFETCFFCQGFELSFGWLALWIFIHLLEFADLISTFSCSFDSNKCWSILWNSFDSYCFLFWGLLLGTHDSLWHQTGLAWCNTSSGIRWSSNFKREWLALQDASVQWIQDLCEVIDFILFWSRVSRD